MNDLAKLQNRIASAFNSSPAPTGEDTVKRATLTPPPLSAEDVFRPAPPEAPRSPVRVSPYLFGGAGLLASAAALALGEEAGFYAVIGGLGSVGIGAVLMHLLTRAPTVTATAAVAQPVLKVRAPEAAPVTKPSGSDLAESRQDEQWRHDENTAIHDSIHDALGDIVLTRDLDGRILTANAAFCRFVDGRRPEGYTCQELGFVFEQAGQPGRCEATLLTPQGMRTFLWHDVTARNVKYGRLVVQSLARDVTDERQLTRTREEARLRAEQASDAKSRLLATVSHEIRTPLGGILGMASLLTRTRLSPEQASYVEGIRQSGEALGQLVDELLDCASIEAGRFTVNAVETTTRPFIESVSEMLAHRAHGRGLEIAVTVAANVPEKLEFDAARVRQVLFNLIGNAVKFTRAGGVLIETRLERSELVIVVTDTGSGMDEAELAKVFGEFEQTGTAGDRSGGTGLGLSISTRIMTALGGSLSAASRKGAGSTFTIRLPVRTVEAANGVEARDTRLSANRVLLVAPAGPAAKATIATLAALGAQCRHVVSGGEAAQALDGATRAGQPFSDIIVDHRLSPAFTRAVPARLVGAPANERRIFLVNPEERSARRRGDFDAWLIRPLREKSLTDVLTGRMSGVEKRDALNDNRILPGFSVSAPDAANETGLKVLLAEDDPINAMLARSTLEKAGHRVTQVSDFGDLLAVMLERDARPDLVMTDLSMPGGDGIDVIGRIRAIEREKGFVRTPILVLSADKRRQSAQRALLNGADTVVEKPAAPERLLAEIDLLCTPSAGETA